MRHRVVILFLVALVAGCTTGEGGVMDKVLTDFGIREAPEGYAQPSDKVYERLNGIGATELKRMNKEASLGVVKFDEGPGLTGKFYKEVKIYEDAYPLDAQRISRSSQGERGFIGYIDYTYTIYESERVATRAEAAAANATIPTGQTGRDTYRYSFGPSGEWNGRPGELTKR